MARDDHKAEIIIPPDTLQKKVGATGGKVMLDPQILKRAEQAMNNLRQEFSGWLSKDIEALSKAFMAFTGAPTSENAGMLFRAAHDLKGQATTFEYPLIARVAASLAKLMDGMTSREEAPLALVAAHVDAIAVIHREKIKDISNLTALTLAEELEARVVKTLERASA
jgi:chemotaxis protein histidine kinase CheA